MSILPPDDLRARLEARAHDCDEAAQAAYQTHKDFDAEFLEDTAKELREAAARLAADYSALKARCKVREDAEYLVWSNEHSAWWRPNKQGYTTKADAAGRYSRAEAIEISACARDGWCAHVIPSEIPVNAADIAECYRAARKALHNG